MRNSSKREMPSWWPEGEPWPSHGHPFVTIRRRRAGFFRRLAFGLFALATIIVLSMLAAVWLIASRTGPAGGAAALPALMLLLVAVAVVLLVFRSMQRIGSPLHAVMDAADRVADGDYAVRVHEYGPPPMRALGHSFNMMTERLQNADRLRRNVMASYSRKRAFCRDWWKTCEHSRCRNAGALPLQREETDLADLVRDVVQSMTPEADKQSISLTASGSLETAAANVDPV